jgi:hypothetical protein
MSVRLAATLSVSQTWAARVSRLSSIACAPCCNAMPSIGERPQAIFEAAFTQHFLRKRASAQK